MRGNDWVYCLEAWQAGRASRGAGTRMSVRLVNGVNRKSTLGSCQSLLTGADSIAGRILNAPKLNAPISAMQTEYLRNVSYSRISLDGELDAMKTLWTLRPVAGHERIVREGEPMHDFYVVCTGVVHVRRLLAEP